MHVDVTGIIAVSGFWTFATALALRNPINKLLSKRKVKDDEVEALKGRVEQLEGMLGAVHQEMCELKESSEFAHKLLGSEQPNLPATQSESPRAGAHASAARSDARRVKPL